MAEIITVERRRRWSDEDKRRIVAETFGPDASVSSVAKRHGLHPGQVFGWRRALHDDARGRASVRGKAAFAPVVVEEPPEHPLRLPPPDGLKTTSSSGRIEIILGRGRRVVVGPDFAGARLRRVAMRLIKSIYVAYIGFTLMFIVSGVLTKGAETDNEQHTGKSRSRSLLS